MVEWILRAVYIVGGSVCHQLPERSFSAGDFSMPLCARCEGIYLGFFIAAIILFIMFRKRESDLPPVYIVVILCLFILSTVLDGSLSYLGVFSTNNFSRFITGYLSGAAAMTIVYPIFNFQYFKNSSSLKIFTGPLMFVVFLLINAVVITLGLLDIGFHRLLFLFFQPFCSFFYLLFCQSYHHIIYPILLLKKSTRLFRKYLVWPSLLAVFLALIELFYLLQVPPADDQIDSLKNWC